MGEDHDLWLDVASHRQDYDNGDGQMGTLGSGGYAEELRFNRDQATLAWDARFGYSLLQSSLQKTTTETIGRLLPAGTADAGSPRQLENENRVFDTKLVTDIGPNKLSVGGQYLDASLVDEKYATVPSSKLDALFEQLEDLVAEGHRALVFSQFTSFLTRVRQRLEREGLTSVYLDGRTRRRGEVVAEFKEGEAPVFLISLKAGGVGLTLTEADYVFVLDPWWNPAVEAQAVDRTHRIGQQRPVMVYRLVATDTIEEKVMELKARKAELFAQVIDGDGAMSTSIGAEDIRNLFAE